ncbi:MAG: hypothetical protein IKJ45_04950, partial [Kiritimatiellae bacterium]|nr:hypothetical protein [Kiritimatiellia bacterium]
IFGLYLKLAISTIGTGNIITLVTLKTETMPQAQYKKVLSETFFAAHLLSFPCARFGLMVSRN